VVLATGLVARPARRTVVGMLAGTGMAAAVSFHACCRFLLPSRLGRRPDGADAGPADRFSAAARRRADRRGCLTTRCFAGGGEGVRRVLDPRRLRAAAHGDCRQCDTYVVHPNMLLFTVSRDANLRGTECLGTGHHDERLPAFSHRHAADIADLRWCRRGRVMLLWVKRLRCPWRSVGGLRKVIVGNSFRGLAARHHMKHPLVRLAGYGTPPVGSLDELGRNRGIGHCRSKALDQ
jgi:hypothetical protein